MEKRTPINALSLEEIKEAAYRKSGDLYKPLITGEKFWDGETEYSERTSEILEEIPEIDVQRICEHAKRVSSLIPEAIFTDYHLFPTSREGVKALIAHAYRMDVEAHQDPRVIEMYIRALSALSAESLYFSNSIKFNSLEVIESLFTADDFSRDTFLNFLAQLEASTMPIANTMPDVKEREKGIFDLFMIKMEESYQNAMVVFEKYVAKHFPHELPKVREWKSNLVFVDSMTRFSIFTNDDDRQSESKFNSFSAAAVAFGVDSISGLPLTLAHRPYNFDEIVKNPDVAPKDNAAYTETLTKIHENIHNVFPERNFTGDWLHLVNELLTDAAAWAITLESIGQDFVNCENAYLVFTGYFDLMLFARNIIKNNILTKDEFIDLGLHQDPKAFLKLFSERITNCDDQSRIEDVFVMLAQRMLIKPIKSSEFEQAVQQFKENPASLLEAQCMEMWELVGNQYTGQKFYVLSIFDRYQQNHPEVGEKDYRAIRNEKGMLIDEAVDIFYEVLSKKADLRLYFLKNDIFIEQMNTIGVNFDSIDVPELYKLDGDDSAYVLDLLQAVNGILRAGLDFHTHSLTNEQKFVVIFESAKKLYEGAVAILQKNWAAFGIPFIREDILVIINQLLPTWLSWKHEVSEPSKLIERILTGLDSATAPIETPDGLKSLGPDRLFYWGPALEIHNQ